MTLAKAPAGPPGLTTTGKSSGPANTFDGKYRFVREIGSGATASVYEAEHLGSGKRVALKILHASVGRDSLARDRFVLEARAVAQLRHPNLVDTDDFGVTAGGTPFLVMELLEGETLERLLLRRGALVPNQATELMVQLLAALGAAHHAGILHRDLKPSNVLITYPRPDAPLVKVLDLGITKRIAPRGGDGPVGTPVYMAPEQALGKDADARADVYSAGVILYEMLAGDPPFTGSTAEVLSRVASGQFRPLVNVNPAVPRLLAHAVSAAMATDVERRIQTTEDFARHLAPFVSQIPHGSEQVSEAQDASRPPRDFPSLGLARVDGRPKGEPLEDSLLQSPVIPRAPGAPKIHISSSIREVERWSNAPMPGTEADLELESSSEPVLDVTEAPLRSQPAAGTRPPHDPLFDDPPSRRSAGGGSPARAHRSSPPCVEGDSPGAPAVTGGEAVAEPPPLAPWRRAAWAAALGIGLGALLALLYRLG